MLKTSQTFSAATRYWKLGDDRDEMEDENVEPSLQGAARHASSFCRSEDHSLQNAGDGGHLEGTLASRCGDKGGP